MHSHILEEYYNELTGLNYERDFQKVKENGHDALRKLVDSITTNTNAVGRELVGSHLAILLQYKELGEKAFQLTENISQLLYNTDVSSITYNMLKLPFQCMYIEFPKVCVQKG